MRVFLSIFLLILMVSCSEKETSTSELVTSYYNGFKESNYEQIIKTLSDSLAIHAGDYVMKYTPESFYEHFKWDSVFKPTYELVKLENQDEEVVAIIATRSLRLEFLKNNPMSCSSKFYFKSGKIYKIEELGCSGVDWQVWQRERDSLVNWIRLNHPKLDGFVNDLSMKGAQNYLKAIEMYKARKDTLPPNYKEFN